MLIFEGATGVIFMCLVGRFIPTFFYRELEESRNETISANRLLRSPWSAASDGFEILLSDATDLALICAF